MQVLSGDFQHTYDKMHALILLGMQLCTVCIFLLLKFYNFIKGIMCIYIVFLKTIRQMFDFKKKCLCVAVYLQSGALYENIRHDLRSEYSRRKSVRSKHQWSWEIWGYFRTLAGFLADGVP